MKVENKPTLHQKLQEGSTRTLSIFIKIHAECTASFVVVPGTYLAEQAHRSYSVIIEMEHEYLYDSMYSFLHTDVQSVPHSAALYVQY